MIGLCMQADEAKGMWPMLLYIQAKQDMHLSLFAMVSATAQQLLHNV